MVLRKDAIPVIQPARHISLALREPLNDKLKNIEQTGIAAKVNEQMDWVSPVVIVKEKGGKLGVCVDPRRINVRIMHGHYAKGVQLPSTKSPSMKKH